MAKARCEVELAVRFGNEPGDLGRVLALLAQNSIKVLAYCAYCEWQDAVALLVTDNPYHAKEILTTAGYNCRANSVVLVNAVDQVGSAAMVGTRLGGAGVNILYSYASSAGTDQFYAVFKTNDDGRAVTILAAGDHSDAHTVDHHQP